MCRLAAAAVLIALVTYASTANSATGGENLLLNPGAEQGKSDEPSMWDRASVPADGLRMQRDLGMAHTGNAALTIANQHQYDERVSNNWMQSLQQVPHGAQIRLRAAIRTRDADAANVCLQCWGASGSDMLAFASTPVLRGDQDWIEVNSTPVVVPDNTAQIVVRAALTGKGQAWFDDLEVQIIDPADHTAAAVASTMPAVSNSAAPPVVDASLPDNLPGRLIESIPVSRDCMVLSYLPEWNQGLVDNVAVANNDGGVRALLAWEPISSELLKPDNRRAYLAVYSRETTAAADHADLQVTAHPILDAWPEKTSWQTQPKFDESQAAATKFVDGEGWKLLDVTALLRDHDDANRNGVMLTFQDEQQTSNNWSGYAIVTREGLGEWQSRRPRLLILEAAR